MSASILVQEVKATTFKSGKSGYICETPGQRYYVFDNDLGMELFAHIGDTVEVETSSKDSFHKIVKFYRVSASPQSPVVEKGAAPPAPSSSRGGGERAAAFQKDPAGLQLSARQTSLNAAVAHLASQAAPPQAVQHNGGSVIMAAEQFYQYLVQDLENVAAGSSGAAKPAGSGTPAATQTLTDDEIPF